MKTVIDTRKSQTKKELSKEIMKYLKYLGVFEVEGSREVKDGHLIIDFILD